MEDLLVVSPGFNQEELTFPRRDVNSSNEIKLPPTEHFWGSSMKVTYVLICLLQMLEASHKASRFAGSVEQTIYLQTRCLLTLIQLP